MNLVKKKPQKCQKCSLTAKIGKPVKLNGEAIASISELGHFVLEVQGEYVAFTDAGVSALRNIIDKWYEPKR